MDKKDVLQYMPMMKGRISYTNDEFKKLTLRIMVIIKEQLDGTLK